LIPLHLLGCIGCCCYYCVASASALLLHPPLQRCAFDSAESAFVLDRSLRIWLADLPLWLHQLLLLLCVDSASRFASAAATIAFASAASAFVVASSAAAASAFDSTGSPAPGSAACFVVASAAAAIACFGCIGFVCCIRLLLLLRLIRASAW
jgi:hypothetical protein